MRWDAPAYDRRFGFVTDYGAALLDLLDVKPPASVLDVGCGTGAHARALADRGFRVVGVDVDEQMLDRARSRAPRAEFIRADVQSLDLRRTFDAALSNAALHWMPGQSAALASVRRHLVQGATFVAEMGGRGNVATVDGAVESAAEGLGLPRPRIRKFFPSVAEQAALLEAAGFGIAAMWSFARPTPLGDGQSPADWSRVFRADVWGEVPEALHDAFAREIDARCAALRTGQGWFIDYHRLRFVATATGDCPPM